MKRSYSFLVLTDHRVHKLRNPIYSLLPVLRDHPDCVFVHIASRGNPANERFFTDKNNSELEVLEVQDEFGFDEKGEQFLHTGLVGNLDEYDCVLMRLPRPVETAFMAFLVDNAPNSVFINHPLGIEKTSNKSFLLNFPELCPPMELCFSVKDILDFATNFPIVLKPLKEYGGKGILKIAGDTLYEGDRQHNAFDFLTKQASYIENQGYLGMKFMEEVTQGDKRILLVGRNIMGASLRLPPEGAWICNVAQGGTSVAAEVEPEEREIIDHIIPFLEKEGILIVGIDTLMGDKGKRVLSEINTLSVGGFFNVEEQSGKPIIKQSIQTIMNYVDQKIRH